MRSKPLSTSSFVIAERGQRVDARGVAQRDEVEPAGAPRAARSSCRTRRRAGGSPRRSRRAARSGTGRRRRACVYAFATPQTSSMSFGPTPAPTHAAPATGFEEVTNGYVPWSMSSSAPWAPSKSTTPVVVERAVGERRGVGDVLLEAVAVGEVLLASSTAGRAAGRARTGAGCSRLGSSAADDLLLEDLLVEHVLHADAQARGLVGVARARCRASSCRSRACRASPRPPGRASGGRA